MNRQNALLRNCSGRDMVQVIRFYLFRLERELHGVRGGEGFTKSSLIGSIVGAALGQRHRPFPHLVVPTT